MRHIVQIYDGRCWSAYFEERLLGEKASGEKAMEDLLVFAV